MASIKFQLNHTATMNIQKTPTVISKVDPLKRLFQSIFDVLPSAARGHVVAAIGELIGTIVFYFMAFAGAQVAFISNNHAAKGEIDTTVNSVTPSMLLYIALSAAFALNVSAWIFYRISGGLFNPIVGWNCKRGGEILLIGLCRFRLGWFLLALLQLREVCC